MPEHTLDVSKLPEIIEELKENTHKLNSWECDRLEEWAPLVEAGKKLSPKQIACIEKMYVKI